MKDSEMKSFHSHGKLMLTGEYAVLDGALSFALPTKRGQLLTVSKQLEKVDTLNWISINNEGEPWFTAEYDKDFLLTSASDEPTAQKLSEIFVAIQKQNPEFSTKALNNSFSTQLEFPQNWGLGSSSTLLVNLAKYANIDPYRLQFEIFGGSGYDIACALHESAILYSISNETPSVKEVIFHPDFTDHLFFVHLGHKQNSRDEIKRYKQTLEKQKTDIIDEISRISLAVSMSSSVTEFIELLRRHEILISSLIGKETIQQTLFSDYNGLVKSLGAWGGDFIMCSGTIEDWDYFRAKGLNTILSYHDMILAI